ncbi:MAG TPA: transcription antitermination factor NusB [Acidimicrobiales bacterium]|nr:transcription antitermination factor NusB [Acidimicrobiales bacterium]
MTAPRPPRSKRKPKPKAPVDAAGVAVRRAALDVLGRIEEEGAYANLATNAVLGRSDLPDRDRHFVTELVFGTTRMRRACEHLVTRHRTGGMSPRVAAALRLGAYQLAFGDVAPHAAVSTTVGAAPKPARGLVNAVLRRIADDVAAGIEWPDLATELSYPDWIVTALTERLGEEEAVRSLRAMNHAATTHVRDDGYVQDAASQRVVASVGAGPGELVLDACAAPGGKATGLAATGASVVAADPSPARARLVVGNRDRLDLALPVVVADAVASPYRDGTFDRVLVDAPCSGLGVLRRRPDARWRIDADAPDRLAELQVRILRDAARVVRPGGSLVYSVCTLTEAENQGVVDAVALDGFDLEGTETMAPDDDADGMYVARWRRR